MSMFKTAIVVGTLFATTSWVLAEGREHGQEEQWQGSAYSRSNAALYDARAESQHMYRRDRYISRPAAAGRVVRTTPFDNEHTVNSW